MRSLYKLCIGGLVCLFGLGVSFSSNAQQQRSTNNGLCWLDQSGQIDLAIVQDECWFNGAKSLEFMVYKIGFCQSAPQPTTSAPLDLSACTVIYDNPSGQSVPISKSAAIPIVDTVPPDVGTYSTFFMILGNSVAIDGSTKFDTSSTMVLGRGESVGVTRSETHCSTNGSAEVGYFVNGGSEDLLIKTPTGAWQPRQTAWATSSANYAATCSSSPVPSSKNTFTVKSFPNYNIQGRGRVYNTDQIGATVVEYWLLNGDLRLPNIPVNLSDIQLLALDTSRVLFVNTGSPITVTTDGQLQIESDFSASAGLKIDTTDPSNLKIYSFGVGAGFAFNITTR
jgi:hypothetical protein